MRAVLFAIAATFACMTGSLAQSTFAYRQLPIFDGGAAFADGHAVRWADDFRLSQDATIRSITWWGTQPKTSDNFSVVLYADAGGKPGAPIPGVELASWSSESAHSHMGHDFQYSGVLLQPAELAAGTRYWISIAHPPQGSWDWTQAATRSGSAAFQNNGGPWTLQPEWNIAFALSSEIPEPGMTLLLVVGIATLHWRTLRKTPFGAR